MSDTRIPGLSVIASAAVFAVLSAQPAAADNGENTFTIMAPASAPVMLAQGRCGGMDRMGPWTVTVK